MFLLKGVFISSLASTSCDFDSALCYGWRESVSDVFNWTRHTGSTSSFDTGPDGDHTSGSGKRDIVNFLLLFGLLVFDLMVGTQC